MTMFLPPMAMDAVWPVFGSGKTETGRREQNSGADPIRFHDIFLY